MAPSQTAEPLVHSDKQSPTQENKPPIPTGAGAKKAMEAYFAGTNHMEFRQRSSSASRTTRTFSRGATPSRDAANAAPGVAGGVVEGAIDPDALKNALKKIPSVEKDPIRPTPPRSRSISRCRSPLPDEELLDESLPDFYKVTLKPTERTGSQTRDIRLAGNRLSRDATPTLVEGGRNRLSRGATPTGAGASDDSVPEFRRVALRRTPSREQLADDRVHKESTLKKSVVTDASTSSSLRTNLSRSGSFTSLTSINKSVLSRRSSTTAADEPEFKGVVLKKTPGSSSSSRQGSRAGSPAEQTGSRGQSNEGAASLKKVESRSRRGSAASSEAPEFTGLTLKKSARVRSEESKFQVESVSLKPIPVGEGEEVSVASSASAGIRPEEESKVSPVVGRRREERASSTCRVQRETKFEGGDDEYSDIKSSLDKLKKKEAEASAAEAAPRKEAMPNDAADAKPIVYRRRKPLSSEEEEAEKVNLKPVNLKKRLSFSSSIECLVKKGAEEVDGEESSSKRPPFTNLKRAPSFTSSLENIAVKEQGEKVHLSCFSKEMGSNVDLVQVCQDQGEGKHEVKLEFEIEGKQVKKEEEEEEEVVEEWTETTTTTTTTTTTEIEGETGETSNGERVAKQEAEEEREEGKLHKLRKAPSIDGLFQRQDVQAAFTFTLPFQKEESTPKLSLEIPNLA